MMERIDHSLRKKGWIAPDVFLLYVVLHNLALGVFFTGVTWQLVALCAGSFFLRMFGLGVGYHRYFAHRSFKTSRPVQFILALLGTLSLQRGVIWWAQTHRYHHRHADTPEDIHSPRYQGFLYAHSGWFMNKAHYDTDLAKIPDLARFPELVWLNDFRVYVIPMGLYAYAMKLIAGWPGFIWGFCLSTVLLWHLTHWIQSMSHSRGGYRRYESADASRNHFLVGLLGLGEWHNNHHHMPSSAKQGHVWWEIDMGYWILKVMSWFGLVWDLRTPERHPAAVRSTNGEPGDDRSRAD
jgi:stearoyl-CoA desaturase (delta-9 desaturase)